MIDARRSSAIIEVVGSMLSLWVGQAIASDSIASDPLDDYVPEVDATPMGSTPEFARSGVAYSRHDEASARCTGFGAG